MVPLQGLIFRLPYIPIILYAYTMTETNFWDDVQALDSGLTDGFDLSGLDEMLGVGSRKKATRKAEASQ